MSGSIERAMIPPALAAAYRRSRYRVDASPIGGFVLRIGDHSLEADRLCERLGHRSWAFLTACNPRSQPLAPPSNATRMARLREILDRRGLPHFPGEGVGDDPAWTPEASVFIPGMDRDSALRLALHFEQYALVYGETGGPAELVESGLGEAG